MTEEQAKAKSVAEAASVLQLFKDKLGVDDEVAQILAEEGFTSVEEIAYFHCKKCWKLKVSIKRWQKH